MDERHERATDTSKCIEGVEVLKPGFIPHEQPPLMPEPGEGAFHRPAPPILFGVLLDGTTLARLPVLRSALGRDVGADATRVQRLAERPAVVASVRDHLQRARSRLAFLRWHRNGRQRRLCHAHLPDIRACREQPEWQPFSIGGEHEAAALPFASQAHAIVPFLAGTKLPLSKLADQSIRSIRSSIPSRVRWMRSQTPSACQRCKRRCAVESSPYFSGKSRQAQPVRKTKGIALSVRRSSARGRPVRLRGGSNG